MGQLRVGFGEQVLVVIEVGLILIVRSGGLVQIGNERTS